MYTPFESSVNQTDNYLTIHSRGFGSHETHHYLLRRPSALIITPLSLQCSQLFITPGNGNISCFLISLAFID